MPLTRVLYHPLLALNLLASTLTTPLLIIGALRPGSLYRYASGLSLNP
jgi:hypothetical protein